MWGPPLAPKPRGYSSLVAHGAISAKDSKGGHQRTQEAHVSHEMPELHPQTWDDEWHWMLAKAKGIEV